MIIILVISFKCKQVFNNIGYLVILSWNQPKKDIIKTFEYLIIWYKQKSISQMNKAKKIEIEKIKVESKIIEFI